MAEQIKIEPMDEEDEMSETFGEKKNEACTWDLEILIGADRIFLRVLHEILLIVASFLHFVALHILTPKLRISPLCHAKYSWQTSGSTLRAILGVFK